MSDSFTQADRSGAIGAWIKNVEPPSPKASPKAESSASVARGVNGSLNGPSTSEDVTPTATPAPVGLGVNTEKDDDDVSNLSIT